MSTPPKADPASRSGLSAVTAGWLEGSDPAERKMRGQFMTPAPVAGALLDRVGLTPAMRVLDPGVGTGELLRAVLEREPEAEVTGWDSDPNVLPAARQQLPAANLEHRSALDAESGGDFDLVVGNPPYFQLRLDPAARERFAPVISGRANIFALFFQVGLEQLRPGGTLAYIVPPSMNSGAYFEGLREHLVATAEVRDLTVLEGNDLFEGANTAVQLLVLEKKPARPAVGRISGRGDENPTHRVEGAFVFRREVPEAGFRRVILSADPGRLEAEFEGRRTLWELGLAAVTGQVVWNQNRDRLVGEPGPGRVPLIWSHSIGPGTLAPAVPGRAGKPSFYATDAGRAPLLGPAIVVNRVVGAVGRGELRAALVPEGMKFLAENHVNVIRRRPDAPEVDWERVLAGLRQPGVAERVRRLTGNTQISARELTHLLPIG